MKQYAIIEIGSNNTKTHIYKDNTLLYENNTTIEFKKHYKTENKLIDSDIKLLYDVIKKAKEYTDDIHIYGCSIFRSLSKNEIESINKDLNSKYGLKIEVVSQEDEAYYTALGCYNDINYPGNICVFIGGGGSIELVFASNGKVIEKKFYNFGVVDITNKYESLKSDIPDVTFDEVYSYIDNLIDEITTKADILILAGGDHLYWYNNAGFKLFPNSLYNNDKQQFMIPIGESDKYDREAYKTSLDTIRTRSDNPIWFDGSRAMKALTNLIAHRVDAKYIIPTKNNMEDGLKSILEGD